MNSDVKVYVEDQQVAVDLSSSDQGHVKVRFPAITCQNLIGELQRAVSFTKRQEKT
jgi:hypothetical protein